MSEEYWEPHHFEVGERVRIRLSPDCFCWSFRTGHGAQFDGALGTVVEVHDVSPGLPHRIEVMPDTYWRSAATTYWKRPASFTTAELEPLPAEVPR